MTDELTTMLPQPGGLRTASAPHQHAATGIFPLTWAFLAAASIPLIAGIILFGWDTVRVLAICAGISLLVESVFRALTRRTHLGWASNALLIGMLLTCTLPPTTPWYIAAIAASIAIFVGLCLPGGLGHYLWHPVVIGRLAVQMLFRADLTHEAWPVLARDNLLIGDLSSTKALPALWNWSNSASPEPFEAWLVDRPQDVLRSLPVESAQTPGEALAQLVRDHLPTWNDILLGGAGGAIGEAAVVAIFVAGLVLMWRGILRLPAVLAGICAAGLAAAIFPIQIPLTNGPTTYWLPGTAVSQGLPVGLTYVFYQVLEGEFLFVLLLLASDISSSPLTARGHILAGAILAVLTIALRVAVGIPAAAYWALLLVNTLTPIINRFTRRRVYGT